MKNTWRSKRGPSKVLFWVPKMVFHRFPIPKDPSVGGKHGPIWQKRVFPSLTWLSRPEDKKHGLKHARNWQFSAFLNVTK